MMGKPPETDMEKYGEEKQETPEKSIEQRAEEVAQQKAQKVETTEEVRLPSPEPIEQKPAEPKPAEDPTQGEVD